MLIEGARSIARFAYPAYCLVNPFVHQNRVVIALGGNALKQKTSKPFTPGQTVAGRPWTEEHEQYVQLDVLRRALRPIVRMIAQGREVIITHGNGPQYGTKAKILEGMCDMAAYTAAIYRHGYMPPEHVKGKVTEAEGFQSGEAGYWTQDFIGNTIKQVLLEELARVGLRDKPVEMVFTSILVDEKDPSFQKPTKAVGDWFTKEEARQREQLYGWKMTEFETKDPNDPKKWRRVVPSPIPLQVRELKSIKSLLRKGAVVIACGGGGVPMMEKDGKLTVIKGVIDKDRASALLARDLLASELVIVTETDYLYTNWDNKEKRAPVREIEAGDLTGRLKRGEFNSQGFSGTMQPKLEAACFFLQAGPGAVVRITHPDNLFKPDSGTRIFKEEGLLTKARMEMERALVVSEAVIPNALIRRLIFSRMHP